MKIKISAVIITLAVLIGTAMNGLWLSRTGEITVTTDNSRGGIFTLKYTTNRKTRTVKAKPDKSDIVSFFIQGKKISYFKIGLPDNVAIKKISFYNLWKTRKLTLTNDCEYTGKSLKSDILPIYIVLQPSRF